MPSLVQLLREPDAWKVLPEPFSSLWLSWDESSQSKPSNVASTQEDHLKFIRSLVLPDSTAQQASEPASKPSPAVAAAAMSNGDASSSNAVRAAQPSQQRGSANSAQEQQRMRQSIHMREAWQAWQQTPDGSRWQKQRSSLPVDQIRASVLSTLRESDFVVVMGDTGSGKTTQVLQLFSYSHAHISVCCFLCGSRLAQRSLMCNEACSLIQQICS